MLAELRWLLLRKSRFAAIEREENLHWAARFPSMIRGQRGSCSSGSEENHQPWSASSDDQSSPSGSSSDGDSFSDVEAECEMKRSQRFSGSLSFEEDQIELKEETSVTEVVEVATDRTQAEKNDICVTNPPRPSLLRPQQLWLAVTRCLSLRWLSVSRQASRKLTQQVDVNQSEDTLSSTSSDSTNESSSYSSTSDDNDASLLKHEEKDVSSRGVKRGPPSRRGISHSSPRLPRARQATDLVLASVILEREMFLRIELVDSGGGAGDYRAEWRLSERTKELAEGVWTSRKPVD